VTDGVCHPTSAAPIIDIVFTQTGFLLFANGLSTACTIGRGVRQGCSLPPLLYLIFDEAVIRETNDNVENGISIVLSSCLRSLR